MAHRITAFLPLKRLIFAVSIIGAFGTIGGIWASIYLRERTKAEFGISLPQSIPIYKQRVRIWIHGDGIRPQITHAKPGLINLTVENKTILNAEIMIERLLPNEVVAPIATIAISPERARGNQELLLVQGEYLLYERGRSRFKTKLVVSP